MQKMEYKNHYLSFVVGIVVVLCLMYSLRSCTSKGDNGTATGDFSDTINVAIEYSPVSFYRYNDTIGGFNYDMAQSIAREHGLRLKFQPIVNLIQSLKALEDNKIDLLIADLPITAEKKGQHSFLEPSYMDRHVLVQLRDSLSSDSLTMSQLELANDTVWIVEGSFVKERIDNLGEEIGDTIYTHTVAASGSQELFMLVADGKVKQAVIPENVAKALMKEYPQVKIATDISFPQFQSWMISDKHPALCDSLNKWISEFKETERYQDLLRRYGIE